MVCASRKGWVTVVQKNNLDQSLNETSFNLKCVYFAIQPNKGAISKAKTKECEKPLCICVAEISSVKYLSITSKSGRVPAKAPHKIALLPIFFPRTASPTEAPRTI